MQTKSRGLNHGKKITIYLSKYTNIITYFKGISHLQTNQRNKKKRKSPQNTQREENHRMVTRTKARTIFILS